MTPRLPTTGRSSRRPGKALDSPCDNWLGHQAGLVAVKPPLTLADLADPEKMSAKIAAQEPHWPHGTRQGYHAVTLGWYQSSSFAV